MSQPAWGRAGGLLSVPTHPAPCGVFSPHPTEASSDHLLVFPGTFPSPGICPPPALHALAPLLLPASAWGCGLARPRFLRGCRREGWTWQAAARPAGARYRVGTGWAPGVGGRGEDFLAHLPGVCAAAAKLGDVPLSGCMHGSCSAASWDTCRFVAAPHPRHWPELTGCQPWAL